MENTVTRIGPFIINYDPTTESMKLYTIDQGCNLAIVPKTDNTIIVHSVRTKKVKK